MVDPLALVFGSFFLVLGGIAFFKPRAYARFQERLDAIGSRRRWANVEPTDWRVSFTRIGGVFGLLVGLFFLLAAI